VRAPAPRATRKPTPALRARQQAVCAIRGAIARKTRPAAFTLTIPGWHPRRLNELVGCSWRKRQRLKRADRELVTRYARLAEIPAAVVKRRVSLKLTLAPVRLFPPVHFPAEVGETLERSHQAEGVQPQVPFTGRPFTIH
jgi:hypothetical protein